MEIERKKILIADDNKTFLMYMAILLKRMGFSVILAENGIETIKLIKLMQPDLVLLDYMMPKMDGISVLRYIKGDKQVSDVNIVMVTVDSSKETIKKSESFDSCGYLIKPVEIDALHEILQNCIFKPMGFVRRHPRIPFAEKVSVLHEGEAYELYAETLSEGGIYIRKKNPLPVGSRLEIHMPINNKSLSLKGAVIYVKGLYADLYRIPPGMAVEFKDVQNDDVMILRNHIKEQLAKDIWEAQDEAVIVKP